MKIRHETTCCILYVIDNSFHSSVFLFESGIGIGFHTAPFGVEHSMGNGRWIGHLAKHHLEIPYRVVINEAVELAKQFGGSDGYRYVNGVLDKVAAEVRAVEVGAKK